MSGNVNKPLSLSQREKEVLMWIACGKTYFETSVCMSVAETTIKAHVRNALRKLNAVNKAHAIAIALMHQILPYGPSSERTISLTSLFGLQPGDKKPAHAKAERQPY